MVFGIINKFTIKRKTLDDIFKHKNITNTITTGFTNFVTMPQSTISIGNSVTDNIIINGDVIISGNLVINGIVKIEGSLKVNDKIVVI
jgi:hypothetical protein